MPETILYGIPNCDSVKKARRWLDEHGVPYRFHDLHQQGITLSTLEEWSRHTNWEALLNRRSTTWRKLPKVEQQIHEAAQALRLMQRYPTLIKRPVLTTTALILVGFASEDYRRSLNAAASQ